MLQNFTLNLAASFLNSVFNGFRLGKFYFKFRRSRRLKFRLFKFKYRRVAQRFKFRRFKIRASNAALKFTQTRAARNLCDKF